jgi:hypothetical protein
VDKATKPTVPRTFSTSDFLPVRQPIRKHPTPCAQIRAKTAWPGYEKRAVRPSRARVPRMEKRAKCARRWIDIGEGGAGGGGLGGGEEGGSEAVLCWRKGNGRLGATGKDEECR